MYPTSSQKKALVAHSKEIQTFFEQTKMSKSITVIFVHPEDGQEPSSTLIEGAPGIGKTTLSKEISVQWAKGVLLANKTLLFLLFLRDPLVQKILSVKDLVKYYYQFDESSENVASSCAECLLHSDGDSVIFVLDGYDEYPESLRQNGFIHNLLQRKLLPKSCLVVTSRPHASAHLHKNFECRVDILGFSKDDRLNYIRSSLKEVGNITTLVKYLESHPSINGLCFVPFNMTVLLWLYKQGITLPNSCTELYNYFICHTIRHHLAKSHIVFHDEISSLESLQQPYKMVIQQLSLLSYTGLCKNQLTFTLDEIKNACPQIDEITGAINCFGLLQAVQHPGIKRMSTTFNFIHFSVQEFLAAYHITCLSDYDEFFVLKEKFMSNFLTNTFSLYVGMTKGQRPAFKKFISGTHNMKLTEFLHDTFTNLNPFSPSIKIKFDKQLAYIRLYKCFFEATDNELCNEIKTHGIFSKGGINLEFQKLLPVDIECLHLFLTTRDEWKFLSLNYCHIGDVGIHILHQFLSINAPSIHTLRLNNNNITSTSCNFIADIINFCKIKALFLCNNLLENIFTVIRKDQLKALYITVSSEPSTVNNIAAFLYENNTLETLDMELHIPPSINSVQWISEKSIDVIADALKYNTKLKVLAFPGLYTFETQRSIKNKIAKINKRIYVYFEDYSFVV